MKAKILNNYYWVIAAVAIIEMTVVGGINNCRSSIFLIPVTEDLGISRGDFSLAISLKSLVGFFMSLFSGVLFVKFGYRKLSCVCIVISAVGLGMMAFSRTLPLMYVAAVLEGVCNICIIAGNPRLVGSWFHRYNGLVMGMVTAATGLGGSLFSIILSKVILLANWQYAYVIAALFHVAIAVLVFLLVRNRPNELGLRPYGEGYIPKKKRKENTDHWEGFTMEALKRKPTYYLMILGTFLACWCMYMAFSVIAPHAQDCGMDASTAASIQSVMLLALAMAKLGCGFLSDIIGAKKVTLIILLATTVSLLLLAEMTGPASAYLAAIIFAVGLSFTGVMPPLLMTSLFGYRSGAKAVGVVISMVYAASMIANYLTNFLRDILGSYRPVFRMTAVVSVGVIVLFLVMYSMANKDRKQVEQQDRAILPEEDGVQ